MCQMQGSSVFYKELITPMISKPTSVGKQSVQYFNGVFSDTNTNGYKNNCKVNSMVVETVFFRIYPSCSA